MISDAWRLLVIIGLILGLDSIYLNLTSSTYFTTLSQIQKSPIQINWVGAIIAYLGLILAAYVITGLGLSLGQNFQIPFINSLLPNLQTQAKNARIYALTFIFFIIYLVYNGTMLAVFKDYTYKLAAMDTLWGTLLGFIVGYVTQLL